MASSQPTTTVTPSSTTLEPTSTTIIQGFTTPFLQPEGCLSILTTTVTTATSSAGRSSTTWSSTLLLPDKSDPRYTSCFAPAGENFNFSPAVCPQGWTAYWLDRTLLPDTPNKTPNECVSTRKSTNWSSVNFLAVTPPEWTLQWMIYSRRRCDPDSMWPQWMGTNTTGNGCIVQNPDDRQFIKSAQHQFPNGTYPNMTSPMVARGKGEKECRGPDLVVLEDGTKFSVTALTEDIVSEIDALALNGTAFPDYLMALKI